MIQQDERNEIAGAERRRQQVRETRQQTKSNKKARERPETVR